MEYCSVNRQQLVESSLTAQIKENDEPVEMNAVEALVQVHFLLFLIHTSNMNLRSDT